MLQNNPLRLGYGLNQKVNWRSKQNILTRYISYKDW